MLVSNTNAALQAIGNFIYPVNSYFITEDPNFDTVEKVQAHFGGTWERLEDGRFLEAGSSIGNKDAGLPNIKGEFTAYQFGQWGTDLLKSGAFNSSKQSSYMGVGKQLAKAVHLIFNANNSNSIYKDNVTTVQPKSRVVYIYRRATLSGGLNLSFIYGLLFNKEEHIC